MLLIDLIETPLFKPNDTGIDDIDIFSSDKKNASSKHHQVRIKAMHKDGNAVTFYFYPKRGKFTISTKPKKHNLGGNDGIKVNNEVKLWVRSNYRILRKLWYGDINEDKFRAKMKNIKEL